MEMEKVDNDIVYVQLTIPGKPFGKQRPRVLKNGITYTPKETVNYETYIKWLYKNDCHTGIMEGPLSMSIFAYFPIPKGASKIQKELMINGYVRPTKKPDADNIIKVVADALNGLAYHDDNQIVSCNIEKFYSDIPRVEVTIIKL